MRLHVLKSANPRSTLANSSSCYRPDEVHICFSGVVFSMQSRVGDCRDALVKDKSNLQVTYRHSHLDNVIDFDVNTRDGFPPTSPARKILGGDRLTLPKLNAQPTSQNLGSYFGKIIVIIDPGMAYDFASKVSTSHVFHILCVEKCHLKASQIAAHPTTYWPLTTDATSNGGREAKWGGNRRVRCQR